MNLDDDLFITIRTYLLNNYRIIYDNIAEENLLEELPVDLKEEVLYREFGKVVEKIKLLAKCENEFVWETI